MFDNFQTTDPGIPGYTQTNGNSEIPGLIRKMSRCERLFFMGPLYTVIITARITGPLDPVRFQQTLNAVSRRHPLLRAKVVFDDRHEAWFSSEAVPPVPVKLIRRDSDRQWLDELTSEVRIPFDIDRGPLIKCVLLHSPDISDLVIVCNHSICDGMALANLVKEILSRYESPDDETAVLDPPNILDLIKPGISLKGLVAQFFVGLANRKWRKAPYYFGPDEYAALYQACWEGRKPGLVLFEFTPEESVRLLSACREHGVTINSAVSAACIAAYSEITGEFSQDPQTIMVPYDMRRRLNPPIGDVFCFSEGGTRFPYSWQRKKSFWENTRDLHKAIHSRLEILDPSCLDIPAFEPSLIDAMTAFGPFAEDVPDAYIHTETLQRFIRDTGNVVFSFGDYEKTLPSFVPSNLGKIDVPESSSGIRLSRIIFLPGINPGKPLVLGGAGTNGGMVFTLTFIDPTFKGGISLQPERIRIRNRALELLGFPEKANEKAMV